ncbi:hypothetical protein BST36_27725 [Mycolicibacterium moriokaense]|jgi:hypothetical protein|uniref:Uncharacterized protein n=1 Tax=Mycolicibacterium moriokaense TaxID=39691 RepID=A0AAD1HA96_9MYCO|nr:hypothetical protein BST36_27725 [Mycolicibacterium moriokaense]BBX00909.1 hypothetical protein MMOR_18450 [Mycolicibacterium moriokaense]
MADDDYCAECGCPVNEHDDTGVCHALDLPENGDAIQCRCPGLPRTRDRRRAQRDALLTQIVEEDYSVLERLGDG